MIAAGATVRRTFFCACSERLGRLLLPITLALVIAGAPAAHADDQPSGPKIDFVDSSAMTIAPEPDGTFATDVALKNTGKEAGRADVVLKNEACSKAGKAAFENEVNIKQGEFAIARLIISGVDLPKTCYVELQTLKEKEQSVVARSLKQLKLSQLFLTWKVGNWLIAALIGSFGTMIIAFGIVVGRHGAPCRFWLGSPSWDFAKSWTSTLTVAGAILSAALTLSALPELTQFASKPGYGTLVLLFSLVVLFAPIAFVGFMRGEVKQGKDGKFLVVNEGNGLLFFFTCFLTLAAGLGQIAVFCLLLIETLVKMDSRASTAGCVLAILLGLPLVVHSINSMRLTFDLEKKWRDSGGGMADAVTVVERPSWPLL